MLFCLLFNCGMVLRCGWVIGGLLWVLSGGLCLWLGLCVSLFVVLMVVLVAVAGLLIVLNVITFWLLVLGVVEVAALCLTLCCGALEIVVVVCFGWLPFVWWVGIWCLLLAVFLLHLFAGFLVVALRLCCCLVVGSLVWFG